METTLSLQLPADTGYARVLTTAAETLARTHGLAQREQTRFQLVTEEFFTYLVAALPGGEPLRVELTGRAYKVCAAFHFKAAGVCLGALNACCSAATEAGAESGEGGDALSLILAGRVADRFRLDKEGHDAFVLQAEVDRVYPPVAHTAGNVSLKPPYRAAPEEDANLLMLAASLASAAYPAWHCPASFQAPARFADMSRDGHFHSVVALDGASHPAGLLCWARSGDKGLAFSGPFVFAPSADKAAVAVLLTDAFLAAVAREKVEIVFSERATPDVPPGYFEPLGSLTYHGPEGAAEQPVLYRHLREDAGETVWAAPAVREYLRDAYDTLAMCRDIMEAHAPATQERERSLFSATLDKGKGLAVLRPLLDGADVQANLEAHVRAFIGKGVANILLYLDLSHAWEAALADKALLAGFRPQLLLPFAGRSDILVLQHAQPD